MAGANTFTIGSASVVDDWYAPMRADFFDAAEAAAAAEAPRVTPPSEAYAAAAAADIPFDAHPLMAALLARGPKLP